MGARLFIGIFLLLGVASCQWFDGPDDGSWVAQVGDRKLYEEDLERAFPSFRSEADSIQQTQFFIENWVRQELLLDKAKEYLNAEEKEIDALVEQYRNAILRNRYEQKLIAQKMDTAVTIAQIEAYYREHSADFILQQPVYRARMVTVPVDAPRLENLEEWLSHEGDRADVERLEEYANKYSTRSALSDSMWYSFSDLSAILPAFRGVDWEPRKGRFESVNDSTFIYAIFVLDRAQTGEVAPLSYVQNRVRSLLLQQRRVVFLENLENNLFREALNRGAFEIKTERDEN